MISKQFAWKRFLALSWLWTMAAALITGVTIGLYYIGRAIADNWALFVKALYVMAPLLILIIVVSITIWALQETAK